MILLKYKSIKIIIFIKNIFIEFKILITVLRRLSESLFKKFNKNI